MFFRIKRGNIRHCNAMEAVFALVGIWNPSAPAGSTSPEKHVKTTLFLSSSLTSAVHTLVPGQTASARRQAPSGWKIRNFEDVVCRVGGGCVF
jgi:hypothetical protein